MKTFANRIDGIHIIMGGVVVVIFNMHCGFVEKTSGWELVARVGKEMLM